MFSIFLWGQFHGQGVIATRTGQNIRKRKDGRWEARVQDGYIDGKPKYKSIYGKTYHEAKSNRDSYVNRNKATETKPFINKNMGEASIEWLEEQRIYIKESSYTRFYDYVFMRIIPALGKFKIQEIDSKIVNKFIQEQYLYGNRKNKGGMLSAKTVADIASVLVNILAYGKKDITELDIKLPKKEQYNAPILEETEIKKFFNYLMLDITYEKLGILIDLCTGIREGELCALKITDFSFQNETFQIGRTLQRIKNLDQGAKTKTKIVVTEPKSDKSNREIPIPNLIKEIMLHMSFYDNAYILTGTKKFVEPRSFINKFKRHLEMAGIAEINVHAIRHSFATYALLYNLLSLKDLSAVLGHSNEFFTISRYVHPSANRQRLGLNKFIEGQNWGQSKAESLIY